MASPDKQKKRAQRAKAKAKQNRMGKPKSHPIHPLLANAQIDEPFDDVEIDLSTFDFADIKENGFDPAHFDDLFQAMAAAEAQTRRLEIKGSQFTAEQPKNQVHLEKLEFLSVSNSVFRDTRVGSLTDEARAMAGLS